MRDMFDSTAVDAIPTTAPMAAGYVDGDWPTYSQLRSRCPSAVLVSITVTGRAGAQVADCESGDLDPTQAAAWAAGEVAAGRQPTIYCNASTWAAVRSEVASRGLTGRVSYWIAQYDGVRTVPDGAVAKQYQSDTAQNLDYSVAADYWPGVDPPPAQPATTAEDDDVRRIIQVQGSAAQAITDGLTKRVFPDPAEELMEVRIGVVSPGVEYVTQQEWDDLPTVSG